MSQIFNIEIEEPTNNSLDHQFYRFEELFDAEIDMIEEK
jgi:hypothetical protein